MAVLTIDITDGLLDDIRSYCSANGIEDVAAEIVRYISSGFNIERYGASPFANMERESAPPPSPNPQKKPAEREASANTPGGQAVGKKVRIIKKKTNT
jgi:hypothetical protein